MIIHAEKISCSKCNVFSPHFRSKLIHQIGKCDQNNSQLAVHTCTLWPPVKLIANWWACWKGVSGAGWDISLEQSTQVSMAILRVATDIFTTTCNYYHQQKGGRPGSKSRLQARMTLKANCMFLHSWQEKRLSPAKPRMRLYRAWLPWKATDQYWFESNFT